MDDTKPSPTTPPLTPTVPTPKPTQKDKVRLFPPCTH